MSSESIKALLVSLITIATVTVFVLPNTRRGIPPTSKTIGTISKYISGSISSMLGTEKGKTR